MTTQSPTNQFPYCARYTFPESRWFSSKNSYNSTENSLMPGATSEMDVSRVDPEEALVDFETIGSGDISADIDDNFPRDNSQEERF